MPKLFDRILIDTIFLLFVGIWSFYALNNWLYSIPVTLALYVMFKMTYMHIIARRIAKKELSLSDLYFAFSMMGATEQRDWLSSTLPQNYVKIADQNSFYVNFGNKLILVACLIKFAPPSLDDFVRLTKLDGYDELSVICRPVSRNTLLAIKKMGISPNFIRGTKLKKYLVKHNAIPSLPKEKNRPEKVRFSEMLTNIICRKKAKYYLFCAATTAIMSVFVPFGVYYLVASAVFCFLTIGSLLRSS